MGKVKDTQLFMLIRNYLEIYLPVHRHAGENTVRSYRTGINQYLDFVSQNKGISRFSITAAMFNYDLVSEYLQWLANNRQVSTATCNNRLAVIRAFISYASACKPEYIDLKSRLGTIKGKKNDTFGKVDYMSEAAVKALMEAPDVSTTAGLQDQFMMVMMYDTGARIQEILGRALHCELRAGYRKLRLRSKNVLIAEIPDCSDNCQNDKQRKEVELFLLLRLRRELRCSLRKLACSIRHYACRSGFCGHLALRKFICHSYFPFL